MSTAKKIALGTDHAGFELKEAVKAWLTEQDYAVEDFGTHSPESTDYPLFVRPAAEAGAAGKCDAGIVFGGSGNGEAIQANKVAGIRCGLCWDIWSAEMTAAHNKANVIALGGRVVDDTLAVQIVEKWLNTPFEGGRHERRIAMLEK